MRIRELRLRDFAVSIGNFVTSYGSETDREHLIVELIADDGAIGLGEACPLFMFTGETAATARAVIEQHIFPAVVGMDPCQPRQAAAGVLRYADFHPAATAAVEMAIYDLAGRIRGLPVCDLLGGQLKSGIRLGEALGMEEPRAMAEKAKAFAACGFGSIKIKVGRGIEQDAAAVATVRAAVGNGVSLRVDANQGFSVTEAIRFIREIEPYGPEYVEQPVSRDDIDGLAEVRSRVHIPIAADESVHSPRDMLELVKRRACDVVIIKLVKCGGLSRGLDIGRIASSAGIDCVVVSPWETAIGLAAGVHLAVCLDSPRCHELGVPDIGTWELSECEGTVTIGGAGLGAHA